MSRHRLASQPLHCSRERFAGSNMEWSGGMEYWSGVLEWTTGVGGACGSGFCVTAVAE